MVFTMRWTSGSSYLRPMRRLMEKIVFSGLVTACRFATWPTRRSPLLVIATTEGVRREPSLFSRTVGSPPSMTAITELVVPRSMPITFAIASRFLPFRTPCEKPLCLTNNRFLLLPLPPLLASSYVTGPSQQQIPRSIHICSTSSSSLSKPFTGKRTLISTPVHAPEILLRQFSVGAVLFLGNMLGKQIDLLAELTHYTFQVGEGSRHNNRLFHTLTSFGRANTILALGSVSMLSLHLAHGRRSACNYDLCRTNNTFSHRIPRLGNVQDRSFRHICSCLRGNGLMPARVESLSGCTDLSHAQLREHRRKSSRNQE